MSKMNALYFTIFFQMILCFALTAHCASKSKTSPLQKLQAIKQQSLEAMKLPNQEKNDEIYKLSVSFYETLDHIEKNTSSKTTKNKEFFVLVLEITSLHLKEMPSSFSIVEDFLTKYSKTNKTYFDSALKDLPQADSKIILESLKRALHTEARS